MMENKFKLTIHMVSSLDGFIAKEDNSISWFETVDHYEKGVALTGQEIAAFLARIDCYVMGAQTYLHAVELSKDHGWAYGDVPVIVLTHQNLSDEGRNVQFYSGDLSNFVNDRLKPNYKNVWMAGGATLAKDFIRLKLANEIRVSIMPIILGGGKLFFDHIGQEQALHLKDVTAYKNGTVELCYEIKVL